MTWDEMQAWYAGLAEDDPTRHEFEAFIYQRLSYACQRKAELLRATKRRVRRSEPLSEERTCQSPTG